MDKIFPLYFLTSQPAFDILLSLKIYIMTSIYCMQINNRELSNIKAEKEKEWFVAFFVCLFPLCVFFQ